METTTRTEKTARHCYAIEWTYGRATDSRTGKRIGTYYRFSARADRKTWLAASETDSTTQSGYRETIAASDSELRKEFGALEREAQWSGHFRWVPADNGCDFCEYLRK